MSNQSFRPTNSEIRDVSAQARRDARRGAVAGGVGGAISGSLLRPKSRKAKLIGALAGAVAGHVVGSRVGRREGARDVVQARQALLRNMEVRLDGLENLQSKLGHRETINEVRRAIRERHGRTVESNLTDDDILAAIRSTQDRMNISVLPGAFSASGSTVDLEAESGQMIPKFTMTPRRLAIARRWGWAVAQSLPDDRLDDAHAAVLTTSVVNRHRQADSPSSGLVDDARKQFAAKVGWTAIENMSDCELAAHLLGAQRRGLIHLDRELTTTDFGMRVRNQDGQFTDDDALSSSAVQKAYSEDKRKKERNFVGAAAAGTGLTAAVIAHKRLRRARLPKLKTSGQVIDVPSSSVKFARIARTMPASPFVGGPRKLIRRPRRGGKLLARVREFGYGNALVEGVIDALGLGGATNPKKKTFTDRNGQSTDVNSLPDPGTRTTSSFALGSLAGAARRFGPDAAVIAGADLTAEEIHDALNRARERKKKRAAGKVQATPGMGGAPTTMSALHATLHEFSDGTRERARKRAAEIGAVGAGGAAGAIAGLKHDQGAPVAHQDLKPGDRVYRRFGPGGIFQHAGVVDEAGRVVHRTSGSSKFRSVKPESFAKTGKAPTFRESSASDLPRSRAAKNASAAAGTRAGKYCAGSNNCQSAVERIASKGRPVSGQLRRAGIGAATGAATVAAAAAILARRNKKKANA